ncbi:unnamed protein product [Heligmosomoides polygyrus]|uniref:Uncharacterized protein n=1 Tax=Heligmosomoides polygyrus TaxID=6339 RepID=A0A183F3G5_HELPZ|nr:unnamed protein product [Heligmosomoides polygyrus]
MNLTKVMFMRNGQVSGAPFSFNGTNISECSSNMHLDLDVNMGNDLAPELGKRKRTAWGAFKSVAEVVKKNVQHRAHLFDFTLLPELTYAQTPELYEGRMNTRASRSVKSREDDSRSDKI